MNSVNIIGRLGRDPETRYTQGGSAVTNFSIAVDETYKETKTTHWFKIVAWAKTAELVQQYLTKGSLVGITGRLQTRQWEDKQGGKRESVEIVADRVQFLTPKSENERSQNGQSADPAEDNEFDSESETEV